MTETMNTESIESGGEWIVVAGVVEDSEGRALKGVSLVQEVHTDESKAHERAKEYDGAVVDGSHARFAGVVVEPRNGPERARLAEVGLSRKGLEGSLVRYDEAEAASERGWVDDGLSRAVVYVAPANGMTAGAKAAIVAACVIAALAVALAVFFAFQAADPANEAQEASEPPAQEQAVEAEVFATIQAEGADDAAVPASIEIVDADSGAIVVACDVPANARTTVGTLPEGAYELSVTAAPVLEDGTTYALPEASTPFEVSNSDPVDVSATLEKIAAEDMTKEQLEAIAGELEEAGRADAAASAREHAATAPSVAGSADAVKKDPSPSKPSSGNSGNSGSSGNAGNTGAPSDPDPEPSKPAHTHNWVAQTEKKWVVDQAAWDEPVYETVEREICNTCGKDVTGFANQHLLDSGRGGCQSWRTEVKTIQTGTIHHDEVGHYETVTVGYACSGCGATK